MSLRNLGLGLYGPLAPIPQESGLSGNSQGKTGIIGVNGLVFVGKMNGAPALAMSARRAETPKVAQAVGRQRGPEGKRPYLGMTEIDRLNAEQVS